MIIVVPVNPGILLDIGYPKGGEHLGLFAVILPPINYFHYMHYNQHAN
jgi:hypothetical protein